MSAVLILFVVGTMFFVNSGLAVHLDYSDKSKDSIHKVIAGVTVIAFTAGCAVIMLLKGMR